MSAPTLKIEPIVSRLIPPEGSKVVGQTAAGDVLYERTIIKAKKTPIKDDNGKDVWARHPGTGEPTYQRFRNTPEEVVQQFYLKDAGNGNVSIMQYHAPDPKEIERLKKVEAVAQMQKELAEALVEEGVSPADFIKALKKPKKEAA